MKRLARLLAAVVVCVLGPALPAVAMVQPALTAHKVPAAISLRPTTAAWYRPDPLCALPIGCGAIPLPRINPYPAGTMQVGATAGKETARAFLGIKDLPSLADRPGTLTLTIPIETLPTDGSLAPQSAHIQVCVTYQPVPNVAAGYDGPAPVCLPSARAVYVATPQPHLVANLHRIQANLPGAKGLALLPVLGAGKTLDLTAWQVAFATPGRKGIAKAMLPLLRFQAASHVATRHASSPQPSASTSHHSSHHSSQQGSSGDVSVGTGDVGTMPNLPLPGVRTTTSPGDSRGPTVAAQQSKPATATTRLVRIGYQYPAVWLLPIGLVILIPFTAKALTRDLTRR